MKRDFLPDLYWFKIRSLHALVDLHGDNSTVAKEAKQLLNDVIIRLNSAFKKAYGDGVLVTVIVSDASHTRRTRSILAQTKDEATDVSKYLYLIRNSGRLLKKIRIEPVRFSSTNVNVAPAV